jgi:hypothetical protein
MHAYVINLARSLDRRAYISAELTKNQRAVRENLTGMQELPVKLDRLESRIVLNVQRDIWS